MRAHINNYIANNAQYARMASRRFTRPDQPAKEVGLRTAKLYQDDLTFIESKGQHPRTIVREALHLYCDAWRTALYLSPMTKEERDMFILNRVPCMAILHTRPDPAVYAQIVECPTIQTITPDIIKRPSAEAMRSWSKPQRDVYIMYGTVP